MKKQPRVRYYFILAAVGTVLVGVSVANIIVLGTGILGNLKLFVVGAAMSIVGAKIWRRKESGAAPAAAPVPKTAPVATPPLPPSAPRQENAPDEDLAFDLRTFDYERHFYVVGGTGQGKSTLISHLALTLIFQGKGCCVIDAKGDLVKTLLHAIPSQRAQDVIYLDLKHPIPLNVFADESDDEPEALIGEIKYLITRGENIEHAPLMQAVLDDLIHILMDFNAHVEPNERATFLDIQFFLEDEERRRHILKRIANQRLKKKWTDSFPNQRTVASIVARLTPITNSPSLSKVFGCPNPKLDIRDVMDNKKILLVDLGGISEPKQILGTLLVAKIRQAAFRRASVDAKQRVPFYLFVDEFQYFQTTDFAHILSVARGYHLHLIMANQFISQLSNEIRTSILGNVGNYAIFCLGHGDANYFSHLFPKPKRQPTLKEQVNDLHYRYSQTHDNLYLAEAELLKLQDTYTGRPLPPEVPTADLLYELKPYQSFYRNAKGQIMLAEVPPPPPRRDATLAESIKNRTIHAYACASSPAWSTTDHDGNQSSKPDDVSAGKTPHVPLHEGKKTNP